MGVPRKARNKKYAIDAMMKEYLSFMANRAHYDERCAFLEQQQSHGKAKLTAGWKRRLQMDLLIPNPVVYLTDRKPETPTFRPKVERPALLYHGRFDRIIRAQNGACYLCGEAFSKMSDASRDHVVPVSRGGKNDANILAACKPCNSAKGDRMPTALELARLKEVNARVDKLQSRSRRRAERLSYIGPVL